MVRSAFNSNESIEQFAGASNWRSVKRWWGKLEKGESI
jgi:hypothetical protein